MTAPSLHAFHRLRGRYLLLDFELAGLYGLETRRLNEKVKRRGNLFIRFCFQLSRAEWNALRKAGRAYRPADWGGRRKRPFAFTEQGVLLLSSLLNDEAMEANLDLVEAFPAMRQATDDLLPKAEGPNKPGTGP